MLTVWYGSCLSVNRVNKTIALFVLPFAVLAFIDMLSKHGSKRKQAKFGSDADNKSTATDLLLIIALVVLRSTSDDLAVPLRRNNVPTNHPGN